VASLWIPLLSLRAVAMQPFGLLGKQPFKAIYAAIGPFFRIASIHLLCEINFYAIGVGVRFGDTIGFKILNLGCFIGCCSISILFRYAAIC
jgi:hypothetical protein